MNNGAYGFRVWLLQEMHILPTYFSCPYFTTDFRFLEGAVLRCPTAAYILYVTCTAPPQPGPLCRHGYGAGTPPSGMHPSSSEDSDKQITTSLMASFVYPCAAELKPPTHVKCMNWAAPKQRDPEADAYLSRLIFPIGISCFAARCYSRLHLPL